MSKAYTKKIRLKNGGKDEGHDVHQSSPNWLLTFVRWSQRDTLRTTPQAAEKAKGDKPATEKVDYSSTRDILVVENDCIQLSVNVNKGNLTHSMSAVLLQTDVNYLTAIAPGDFVFVNMLNWSAQAEEVRDKALAKNTQPINGPEDGFKGLFKIQSVRRTIQTDPGSGTKTVVFRISGFAFTEFNSTVYFQPELVQKAESENVSLYVLRDQINWSGMATNKGLTTGQDLMRAVLEAFIGNGLNNQARQDTAGNLKSPNSHYLMPSKVGALLGLPHATAAKDIYNYLFGIQKYGAAVTTDAAGFNPIGVEDKDARFLYTPNRCVSESLLKTEYWNQVKIWSILNQFVNSPLNELYSTFRIAPNGSVMPTIVYRQIPFTNEDFEKNSHHVTTFMSLPRWHIDPALVFSVDIGRDEAARVNFVQYFGRSMLSNGQWGVSEETAMKNYLYDIEDVQRSGLKPYVVSANFDITNKGQGYSSPIWAKIVGDALIGGHLKLNGSLECVGISEPIAVGDNLQFDGVVYHIEEVAHSCVLTQDGKKMFRTKISISSGLLASENGTRYAEMENPSAEQQRLKDFKYNQIEPGYSEAQDVHARQGNVDVPDKNQENNGFKQPNSGASTGSTVRRDLLSGKDKDKK